MLPIIKNLSKFLTNNTGTSILVSRHIRNMSSSSNSASEIEERKIRVDGVDINYVRTGAGNHPVLLLPGAMGSIWTDFKPQIDHLDKKKLTIISWDAPGYGKSIPPNRSFPLDFFKQDATWACNLMKALGYNEFSLVGWSDGGITALILAAEYPTCVKKLIVAGTNAYIAPGEMIIYEELRNIDSWSERMKQPYISLYGEEYFRKGWSAWVDAMHAIYYKKDGDICKSDLAKIKCPTLIVHGSKDVLVLEEHPNYLKAKIKNSRVEIFKNGSHNLHLRYPNEFNALVEKFLDE